MNWRELLRFVQPHVVAGTLLALVVWLPPFWFLIFGLVVAAWSWEVWGYQQFSRARISNVGVVLVTGASSGIGKEIALHLAQQGHTVYACVRKQADGDALLAEPRAKQPQKGRLNIAILDVTKQDTIDAAYEQIQKAHNNEGLLAVINNAGISHTLLPFEGFSLADAQYVLDVNLVGVARVTNRFLPLLRVAASKGKSPRVIMISSGAGIISAPFLWAYNSAKFGLEALADTLRCELYTQGIKVSVINPGTTQPVAAFARFGHDNPKPPNEAMAHLPEEARKHYVASLAHMQQGLVKLQNRADHVSDVAIVTEHAVVAPYPKTSYVLPACYPTPLLKLLPKWIVLQILRLI